MIPCCATSVLRSGFGGTLCRVNSLSDMPEVPGDRSAAVARSSRRGLRRPVLLGALAALFLICCGPLAVGAVDLNALVYPPLPAVNMPNVEEITLDNGLRLYLLVDRSLPLLQGVVRVHGGGYLDPADKIGLGEICGRLMRIGGVILAAFIIFHILHFTTGQLHPAFSKGGAYGNVVLGFKVWWVAVFYIVAMSFLGLHLYHGVWAGARTLGLAKPSPTPMQRRLALGLAVIIWAGFIAVPVGVLLGIVD